MKRSNYGKCFQQFLDVWKQLPNKQRHDLHFAAEMFGKIAVVTHGPRNELCHLEKNSKRPLTQLDVLTNAQWLQTFFWSEGHHQFDSHDLGEQLNSYISFGLEWPYLERLVLRAAVHRAAKEEHEKVKIPVENGFLYLGLRLLGFLLPIAITVAVDTAILVWSLNHLNGDAASIWAIIGLVFVGVTVPIGIVHYGTSEIRRLLKRIVDPTWDPYEPRINDDLRALNAAVNGYRDQHINLRLVREQITRLQSTDIHIPVQLLTLIDRSVGKGVYSW